MTKFETGKTYFMRSICNWECIWRYNIISRTDKMITLQGVDRAGEPIARRKIKVWDECETVMPLGSYSMSPQLTAKHIT